MKKYFWGIITMCLIYGPINAQEFQIYPDSADFLLFSIDESNWELESYAIQHFNLCNTCDTDSLPLEYIYQAPGDFGYIVFRYLPEFDTIFFGTIIWMGENNIIKPEQWFNASELQYVYTIVDFPTNPSYYTIGQELNLEEFSENAIMAWEQIESLEYVSNLNMNESGYYAGFYRYPCGDYFQAEVKWIIILYSGNIQTQSKSLERKPEINIFPNPSNGIINITNALPANYSLINMLGEIYYASYNFSESFSISTQTIPTGLYTLQIESETFKMNKKILITN